MREWIPASERGMANAIFISGSYAGPALGAPDFQVAQPRLAVGRAVFLEIKQVADPRRQGPAVTGAHDLVAHWLVAGVLGRGRRGQEASRRQEPEGEREVHRLKRDRRNRAKGIAAAMSTLRAARPAPKKNGGPPGRPRRMIRHARHALERR